MRFKNPVAYRLPADWAYSPLELEARLARGPLDTLQAPHLAMVNWLKHGDAPARFSIDQDLELQSRDATRATRRSTPCSASTPSSR